MGRLAGKVAVITGKFGSWRCDSEIICERRGEGCYYSQKRGSSKGSCIGNYGR